MKKLLLVEDEDMLVAVMRPLLEKKGFAVDVASTVEEGMIKADGEYEVAILDIDIKGERVFPILKKIKEDRPDTVVLMFSGYYSEEEVSEARKLGADDFIPKTFRQGSLKDFLLPKIDFLLQKKKTEGRKTSD